ncbi:MAG TPA: hypothetical protein VKJ01_17815, partial [Candidatus Solibacter sp.]|nr:hypothetical protein [Candidatus Solibacter sp.]
MTRKIVALAAPILLLASYALADDGSKASVLLSTSNAAITQTSDTAWSLAKTGALVPATSTVNWAITATQGATVGGHLVVSGFMDVVNTGSGPATIGNIVVNLQALVGGRFVTESSDIADSTKGDAATTAHVVARATTENAAVFTENGASGKLAFMDKTTNTIFSLVPPVTIPAGATVHLLFSAAFDNNVLKLAAGTAARTEVIVTFGRSSGTYP